MVSLRDLMIKPEESVDEAGRLLLEVHDEIRYSRIKTETGIRIRRGTGMRIGSGAGIESSIRIGTYHAEIKNGPRSESKLRRIDIENKVGIESDNRIRINDAARLLEDSLPAERSGSNAHESIPRLLLCTYCHNKDIMSTLCEMKGELVWVATVKLKRYKVNSLTFDKASRSVRLEPVYKTALLRFIPQMIFHQHKITNTESHKKCNTKHIPGVLVYVELAAAGGAGGAGGAGSARCPRRVRPPHRVIALVSMKSGKNITVSREPFIESRTGIIK
ncbi:hypothetical protein EVAR_17557_1 [Eumeta japonica]|uniref:Uncharacterized protein n=1 Tax=Eumeta variegata TaxID=151549 RepID=A0A4C1UCR6_EUMVA|nr:hypothetical protein EVAR_17557_1 [Eumeta japonica]